MNTSRSRFFKSWSSFLAASGPSGPNSPSAAEDAGAGEYAARSHSSFTEGTAAGCISSSSSSSASSFVHPPESSCSETSGSATTGAKSLFSSPWSSSYAARASRSRGQQQQQQPAPSDTAAPPFSTARVTASRRLPHTSGTSSSSSFHAAASPQQPAVSAPLRPPTEEEKRRAITCKERGNECFRLQFWEAAVESYTASIRLDPTEPTYRTNRALAYMKQAKWDRVMEDSRQALAINDEFFKAYYLLGMGLSETGQTVDAIKKLNRAKSLAPHKKHVTECDRAIYIAKKKKMGK